MRYSDLQIETQRQTPARARSEGAATLRRAGYTDFNGRLTALGRRMQVRLTQLAQSHAVSEVFSLLELPVLQADDETWFYSSPAGRQEILHCSSDDYAARREFARFAKFEGKREALEPLERVATPECHSIEALAQFLKIPKDKTAKALMYTRTKDGQFIFVVIRGDLQLSEAKLSRAVGQNRPATTEEIVRVGAVPGYASPIGLRSAQVVVDDLIPVSTNLVAGANEDGYHYLNTNFGRDYSSEIVTDLAMANSGDACPKCGSPLILLSGEPLLDPNGIHVQNVLTAMAEAHHDEKGLTWPSAASPFDVHLLHLAGKELDTRAKATDLHDAWQNDGLAVLLDDRDERAGVKFADADLIGCPVRATVGERAMRDGMVEFKLRTQADTQLVPFADSSTFIRSVTHTAP